MAHTPHLVGIRTAAACSTTGMGHQWTERSAPLTGTPVTETVVTETSYTQDGAQAQYQYAEANVGIYAQGPNLNTNRSLLKFILLSIIAFSIYPIYIKARAGEGLELAAARWGRQTYHKCLVNRSALRANNLWNHVLDFVERIQQQSWQ